MPTQRAFSTNEVEDEKRRALMTGEFDLLAAGRYQRLELHRSSEESIEGKDGKCGSLKKASVVGWTAGVLRQRQRSFRDTRGKMLRCIGADISQTALE